MVVTAEVLVASWIAGSILFLALAGFCSALGPASALEHPLPIVHAVEPRRLPHANFQLRDIVDGEQLLVTEGEPVSCKVSRDSALPRKKKMTKVKLKIKMKMELKRILVSSRVTNKVEIDDVSQTLSTFLTGMNFPNYLASLEKSSE